MTKRILSMLAIVALAACGGDAEDVDGETTVTQDTFVEPDTTMAPVVTPVVTPDTGIVQTETEVDVDVETDTIRQP